MYTKDIFFFNTDIIYCEVIVVSVYMENITQTLNNVIQLAMTNRVTLVRVPEHSYIKGNGMADKLAK